MSMRITSCSMALAVLLTARVGVADPVGSYLHVTPFAGGTIFSGRLHFPAGNALSDWWHLGGRVGYQFIPSLGFEVAGGFTPATEAVQVRGDGSKPFDVDFVHLAGDIVFSPWPNLRGGPFVLAGGGLSRMTPSEGEKLDFNTFEFGGGIRYWLTDGLGLRVEARSLVTKARDQARAGSDRFTNFLIGGGFTVPLGGSPRDTDLDGVPDRKDRSPGTPAGARVDAFGVPIDSDGDGVFDGIDQCASTPTGATVDLKGCPSDPDGDGVFDGIDQCADTPRGATVDATGCPSDPDGDGVFDGIDQCADTPQGAVVDERGCPLDGDGDGVPDGLDKCPDSAVGARVDEQGCTIGLSERRTELLDTGKIVFENIKFETGKADLLPEAMPGLNVIGELLTKWPQLKIEIGGHTDARGSGGYNQNLSDKRAAAVKEYLTRTFPGLLPEQFTTKGYGESRPRAANDTEENLAKNRRVEFTVLNKEVLEKEVEVEIQKPPEE